MIILAWEKLAFCKNLPISCIVVSWTKTWVACEYIQSTHWLATGYLIDQAWENRSSKKSSLETIMRTRTFPVRMPVGLRQMAWVLLIDEDFRCLSLFGIQPLWLYLCKTVCMDVRLLLFSFCAFSEHWALGSLYTCIRWSRLMSRDPHSGIQKK